MRRLNAEDLEAIERLLIGADFGVRRIAIGCGFGITCGARASWPSLAAALVAKPVAKRPKAGALGIA